MATDFIWDGNFTIYSIEMCLFWAYVIIPCIVKTIRVIISSDKDRNHQQILFKIKAGFF